MDKESLINQGVEFFDKEEYENAIQCFQRVLDIEPKNFIALDSMGRSLYLLEDYEKSIKFLTEAVKFDAENPNLLWVIGSALSLIGKYREAIDSFDKALEIQPDFVDAIIEKGLALLNLRERRMSIEYFNNALEIVPENIEALSYKGRAFAELNKFKEAIECLEKLLSIDPENLLAIFDNANYLEEIEKYKEALKTIEKAIEIEPRFTDAWNLKGYILMNMGNDEEALNCFDQALDLDSDFYLALFNKGVLYNKQKNPYKALENFDHAIDIEPNFAWSWLQKGSVLKDLGKEKESIEAYMKFVDIGKANEIEDQVTVRRVKDYIKQISDNKPIIFPPRKKKQYWQWVTRPKYFLEPDGSEREALEPQKEFYPGSWWGGAHKDTIFGDLILLYRAGERGGKSYKDIKYLIMAESSGYLISDIEYAATEGWNYACDYRPLFKFKNPLKLEEIKKDPYLDDWNAKNANFNRSVYKTEPRHWKRLMELLKAKNPDFKQFLDTFNPQKEIELILTEKEFEDKLARKLEVMNRFGYDLELIKQQQICEGQGGYIDLYCKDKSDDSLVVIELKIVRANRNTIAQILDYMGWVEERRAFGKPVKGIVISKGKDTHFDSALRSSKNDVKHVELGDLLNELGLKLK